MYLKPYRCTYQLMSGPFDTPMRTELFPTWNWFDWYEIWDKVVKHFLDSDFKLVLYMLRSTEYPIDPFLPTAIVDRLGETDDHRWALKERNKGVRSARERQRNARGRGRNRD